MSKTLVRSLIAGSVSAVASLSLFAGTSTVHASGSDCAPIYTDNGDGTASVAYPDFCPPDTKPAPPVIDISLLPFGTLLIPEVPPELPPAVMCEPLDLSNLEVRAAQTSPDDFQWRFLINGDTSNLCNDSLDAVMLDVTSGVPDQRDFTVWNIVDANDEGGDYIVEFATPCHYDTMVHFGETHTVLDSYLDQMKKTVICNDELRPTIPVDTIDTPTTDVPTDSTPVPGDTVPTGSLPTPPVVDQGGPTTTVPGNQHLPTTGSSSTGLLVGAGMLVVGLGLGCTSMSMTRKRRHTA